jgi:hypothetical protein
MDPALSIASEAASLVVKMRLSMGIAWTGSTRKRESISFASAMGKIFKERRKNRALTRSTASYRNFFPSKQSDITSARGG